MFILQRINTIVYDLINTLKILSKPRNKIYILIINLFFMIEYDDFIDLPEAICEKNKTFFLTFR